MSQPASSLSPVQLKVAELLASGVPLSHAAAQSGVSRQSIYNWLNSNSDFAQAVENANADYVAALKDQLQHLSQLALNALQQILEDPKAAGGVKLRAALAVLKRPTSMLKPGWNLPVAINPQAQALMDEIDNLQASAKYDRLTQLDTNSVNPDVPPQIARNAACPCGSGEKYKRCCGKNAPPVLNQTAAA